VTELTDPWADRAYLRDVQYRTDANLAARQSIYCYQQPHIDLQARVIDLAAPAMGETVCDVGCGNGTYLAELAEQRERVTLDDGESLARHYFSTVSRHDFVSELRIPDQEPIADYVRSMSGTQHSADSERLVAALVSRFPAAPAAPGAVVTVTTHVGCLICTV
jgi:hypothetical protein